ncbi:MAG: HAD family hydrolase [Chloroflexi bacterium]|nr:HAD family hydrolase [Chloroflexota bacterium]
MTRLLLFDVDNTLLWSGGAGGKAMGLAFHDLFGIDDGFKRVEFSGRTDRYILAEALRQHRIDGDYEEHQARFRERYYAHLPKMLHERQGRLMPGFPALLDVLSRQPGVRIGLATGNFSQGAQLKLAHYGIDGYFSGGGFGEESEDRAVIVRRAVERLGKGLPRAEAVVIGDTPHDISSAKANGAIAVGVATGTNSVEELRESGADVVFEDFSDWQPAAATLIGAQTGARPGGA